MEQYETVQGDTWDIIAKKLYGNEKYAGFLMQCNWPHLETEIFPCGVVLNIPELTEEADDDLPIWRD